MNEKATEHGERVQPLLMAAPDPRQMVEIAAGRIKARDYDNALAMLQGALNIDPENVDAYNCLSTVAARSRELWWVSLVAARRALANDPDNTAALSNAGINAWRMGRLDVARKYLERAFELDPKASGINHNLGLVYYSLNHPERAINHYKHVLSINPGDKGCRSDMALATMKSGRLHDGLVLHEGRWDGMLSKSPVWECGVPTWEGEDLNDKILVVHHEQGFGDTIQFIRFVTELEVRYPSVLINILVPASLVRLMRHNYGARVLNLDAPGDIVKAMRGADFHCPMLSVVRVMGVEFGTLPTSKPYLRALGTSPPNARRDLYQGTPQFSIGVIWAASPGHRTSRMRSVDITRLMRLAEIKGVQLYSLQAGPFAKELQESGAHMLIKDCMVGVEDFAGTAQLMMDMDLILSVDSGPAHLAAALGRPTWMFNPFTPCWRWCKGAGVWYDTMQLFDQRKSADNWTSVIDEMAVQIAPLAARKIEIGWLPEAAHG